MVESELVIEKMRKLAGDVCLRLGVRLYDVEFISGSHGVGRTVRVYVDETISGQKVSLEECAKISRGISEILDSDDFTPEGEYSLEVSSPGLDRPLRERWHFESVVGAKIELKTKVPLETLSTELATFKNRSKVTGRLLRVDGEQLVVEADGAQMTIPIEQISKSKRIYEFESDNNKLGQKKKQKG